MRLKRGGIALKTFLFSLSLTIFVVVISFAFLYILLPKYYLKTKFDTLEKNAVILAKSLANTQSEDSVRPVLQDFIMVNNTDVFTYDSKGEILMDLSTPFITFDQEGMPLNVKIIQWDESYEAKLSENPSSDESALFKVQIQDIHSAVENSNEDSENLSIAIKDDYVANPQEIYPSDSKFISIASPIQSMAPAPTMFYKTYTINSSLVASVSVSTTFQPIGEATGVIFSLMPYVLIISVFISLLASYFFSSRLTKPIVKIANAADKMSRMEDNAYSNVCTDDELGLLSQNLDNMYRSLCENINSLRYEMNKVAQMERSKADFMRSAGHELKTPIAALSGIVEGMMDNIGVYKNREKYLAECKMLINTLSSMVSEILNASRADTAISDSEYEFFDLDTLVSQAMGQYLVPARNKRLHINFEGNSFQVKTSRELLYYSISNILSNAVKYTPENGSIYIRYDKVKGRCRLAIENDTDRFITNDETEQWFEAFYTPEYSRNKSKSGTGLGLYIVKRNLEMLEIDYEAYAINNIQQNNNSITGNGFGLALYFDIQS
ncbi:sensor histidine kinase [Anaeropeptidivorans aminofermentans]|uniref:sensor histidine kinase n=1 Tax=Anaeropeptidivorans aminofermentans TaxID=2934315 RepID=UPI002024866D|nr:HAMP domain-containing sensor histidine kinase [Anaeropeptidivorans aminofermentans]